MTRLKGNIGLRDLSGTHLLLYSCIVSAKAYYNSKILLTLATSYSKYFDLQERERERVN